MSVDLPTWPSPATYEPRQVSYGSDLTPPMGGDIQRMVRLGDRWAMDITMPTMTRSDADFWIAALMAGFSDSVVLNVPQPKNGVGAPGAPQVNGANQSGITLALKGLTVGYNLNVGQWLSIIVSGRRYLHRLTASVVANGSGQASVSIWPMLRVSPANSATVEIVQPKIEGLVKRDSIRQPMITGQLVNLSFSIMEQK